MHTYGSWILVQYSEIWGKNALHRNRAMWSFSQDTAANLTDPLGCNKACNCSTLSVHQTSSDAIIGVVSGNQRQKPSRYLPDIWTKRGPRDSKGGQRSRWQKKVLLLCESASASGFQSWQWFIPTKICQHKSAQCSILTKRIIYTVFWPDSVKKWENAKRSKWCHQFVPIGICHRCHCPLS